jgi:amidase
LAIGFDASPMFAIGGYPAITVPAGICFGRLEGTKPKLIEIYYDFEQP